MTVVRKVDLRGDALAATNALRAQAGLPALAPGTYTVVTGCDPRSCAACSWPAKECER